MGSFNSLGKAKTNPFAMTLKMFSANIWQICLFVFSTIAELLFIVFAS